MGKIVWWELGFRKTSRVTMSNDHLVWRFILRALNYHSNLNLLSNQISSINDKPYPIKPFNCLLAGLRSILYQYYMQYLKFINMFHFITFGCYATGNTVISTKTCCLASGFFLFFFILLIFLLTFFLQLVNSRYEHIGILCCTNMAKKP